MCWVYADLKFVIILVVVNCDTLQCHSCKGCITDYTMENEFYLQLSVETLLMVSPATSFIFHGS